MRTISLALAAAIQMMGRNDRLVAVSVFVGCCAAVYWAAHTDSMILWLAAAPLGAFAGFAAGARATIVLSTYFGK